MRKRVSAIFIALLAFGMTSMAAAIPSDTNTAPSATSGDVSAHDVSVNDETTDWSAFYGNLSATVTLSDGSNTFYEWSGSDVAGSAVLAAEDGTFSGNAGDLAGVSDLSGTTALTNVKQEGVDSVNNTYTGTGDLSVGELDFTGNVAATVGDVEAGATAFQNYLLEDTATGDNAVFASEVQDQATGYDGSTLVDYQLLVGNPGDASTTYAFYAEIA